MKIFEVRKIVKEFLQESFGQDAEIIQIKKTEEGWLCEGVIYEESAFIKSVGLPTKVQDRNVYAVELTDDLEIISYMRKKDNEEE
ncbi:MAG: hypothetical protein K9L78_02040 [Victivallales bacterium]|nr:hypothetical protein [Victivallales bacterium]